MRAQVERLEHEIDTMNDPIEPLKTFILPGGSQLAAHLHVLSDGGSKSGAVSG